MGFSKIFRNLISGRDRGKIKTITGTHLYPCLSPKSDGRVYGTWPLGQWLAHGNISHVCDITAGDWLWGPEFWQCWNGGGGRGGYQLFLLLYLSLGFSKSEKTLIIHTYKAEINPINKKVHIGMAHSTNSPSLSTCMFMAYQQVISSMTISIMWYCTIYGV